MKRLSLYFTVVSGVFLILNTYTAYAQISNRIAVDQSGTLLRVKNTDLENVVGSPYLLSNWVLGKVKFSDANPKENVALKFDLMDNVLVVKGKDEEENIFDSKVVEFTLNDSGKDRMFRDGFRDSKSKIIPTYFEVLYDGKVKFLVKEAKMIIESKGYNTGTVTKNFDSTLEYYIAKANSNVNLVKLNEKSILSILDKPELSKYIKDNKLNLKNVDRVVKLLQYYDSL